MSESYSDLAAYQKGMDLARECYSVCKEFPRSEQFGLISQLQRGSTSIPLNIAEGYGRIHRGDYIRGLSVARGSAFEVRTILELAVALELVQPVTVATATGLANETIAILTGLIRSLARERH